MADGGDRFGGQEKPGIFIVDYVAARGQAKIVPQCGGVDHPGTMVQAGGYSPDGAKARDGGAVQVHHPRDGNQLARRVALPREGAPVMAGAAMAKSRFIQKDGQKAIQLPQPVAGQARDYRGPAPGGQLVADRGMAFPEGTARQQCQIGARQRIAGGVCFGPAGSRWLGDAQFPSKSTAPESAPYCMTGTISISASGSPLFAVPYRGVPRTTLTVTSPLAA